MGKVVQERQINAPQVPWIKERVLSGRYAISEHIIRFLTAGKLTMAEIETALLSGQIVEFRVTRQKRQGSLVRGTAGKKIISTLCAEGDGQQMIILLAYTELSPGWEKDQDIYVKLGDFMEDNTRQCFFCGGEIKPIVVGNFDYRLEGLLYVIKNVPAGLCLICGEKYIAAQEAKKINACIETGKFNGADVVRIIDYAGV